MSKQSSDEMSRLAAQVHAAGNPLENDKLLDETLKDLDAHGFTTAGRDRDEVRQRLKNALAGTFAPSFRALMSLAGSVRSQDETPGDRGR